MDTDPIPNSYPESPEVALWVGPESPPAHLPLYQLAASDARDAARVISCHQDIAADSCFAVGFLTAFAGPLRDAPWAYRELFWETGVLGQILYLEAVRAVAGRGTFPAGAVPATVGGGTEATASALRRSPCSRSFR